MRPLNQRFFGYALVMVTVASGCSFLTEVDWAQIPAKAGSAGAPSEAGAPNGGVDDGGSAPVGGAGGEAGEHSAGEGGGAGETSGGSAGSAGFSGGGMGGSAGGGGGGMGGSAGSSGSSGTAGTGGSGTIEPTPCTGTESAVTGADIVLFDGGPGAEDTPRGGRIGLDATCEAARVKAKLTQTKTHAFITVDANDSIGKIAMQFPDIPKSARVVGPTGILLATDLADLIDGTIAQSFICGKVVAPDVKTWLTGSALACILDGSINTCGHFDGNREDTCSGWTLGGYHSEIQARYGRTDVIAATSNMYFDLRVSCNAATDHTVCLAYTP